MTTSATATGSGGSVPVGGTDVAAGISVSESNDFVWLAEYVPRQFIAPGTTVLLGTGI